MTLGNTAALFGTMVVLALVPSVSVLAVSARAGPLMGPGALRGVHAVAGVVLVAAGVFLVATA